MPSSNVLGVRDLLRDLTSGMVVFLVAIPLCLGIALACEAPLISGLLSGIVGGILVGLLSGSHTSVSGPAAGLTAVIVAQIATLGSFETFLLALLIGGATQIVLGIVQAGSLSAFFPSSVIKGLLAAIGVLLILKQIPHVLGRDTDPEGDMSFTQPDHENTFSELAELLSGFHMGAAIIGLSSIAILVAWDKLQFLKRSPIPAPLIVVLFGVGMTVLFGRFGGQWSIENTHLVQVPVPDSLSGFFQQLYRPDWSQWLNPQVYMAGVTLAIVASLETLLNLEGVDKLDPKQRTSPPSRELIAQGAGNITLGLIGGIPVTSVIVRGTVNIHAGAQTKLSTIFHGILLLVSVAILPAYLNWIPLSCLAAVLLVTGFKLASPALMKRMWSEGRYQFAPFFVTLVAIIFTDLLIGVVLGLAFAIAFILYSNVRRPIRRIVEKHLGGDVLHIELANQVSFLNRAALERVLREAPRGSHVLLDATSTDYIDPDILDLIRDFKESIAPAHDVQVSLRGFREKYRLDDQTQFVDCSTRDLQQQMTPAQVLKIFRDGNQRFREGRPLIRSFNRQVLATASGQHPLAVVLSCIDSRTPVELILDLGLGDVFSVRIAGNVARSKVFGSMEYGCAVAGAKLILVLGHTQCGAVTTAVHLACSSESAEQATGCRHLEPIMEEIQQSIDKPLCEKLELLSAEEQKRFINQVAERNVLRVVERVTAASPTLERLVRLNRVAIVGAMYDVATGEIRFLMEHAIGLKPSECPPELVADLA